MGWLYLWATQADVDTGSYVTMLKMVRTTNSVGNVKINTVDRQSEVVKQEVGW